MASLTISIGAFTSTVEADNTKAQEILSLFVQATEGPTEGTNQEQLDYITAALRNHLVAVARSEKQRVAAEAAIEESNLTPVGWEA